MVCGARSGGTTCCANAGCSGKASDSNRVSSRRYMDGVGIWGVRNVNAKLVNANYKHWNFVCPHRRLGHEGVAADGFTANGARQEIRCSNLPSAIDNHSHCDLCSHHPGGKSRVHLCLQRSDGAADPRCGLRRRVVCLRAQCQTRRRLRLRLLPLVRESSPGRNTTGSRSPGEPHRRLICRIS